MVQHLISSTFKKNKKISGIYKTNNYTQKYLGDLFNIDASEVSRIVNGKKYTYLKDEGVE